MQMNENMRTIYANMKAKNAEIATIPVDDEHEAALTKALDELESMQKAFDLAQRAYEAERKFAAFGSAQDDKTDAGGEEERKAGNGFELLAKKFTNQPLSPEEFKSLTPTAEVTKALTTGGSSGESFLIPEDVRTAINELRRSYVSLRDMGLVTTLPTQSMTGSFVFESGTPTGLVKFADGAEIDQTGGPVFVQKGFAIELYGKIIPVSNVLTITERAGLLAYLNKWFVKNAVLSENLDIIAEYKNGMTAKSLANVKALKGSINKDLDPSCKLVGSILTNQDGFDFLDEETDNTGRPLLQPDPTNETVRRFKGMTVNVAPTAQLANEADGSFPIFYGDIPGGVWMPMLLDYYLAASAEAGFTKNMTYLRCIEGYDLIGADKGAYIYGKLKAASGT